VNIPSGWELVLVLLVFVVVFGAKRLPDSARSLGRSLRIFKAETKGLRSDEDGTVPPQAAGTAKAVPAPQPIAAPQPTAGPQPTAAPQPRFDAYTGQPLQPEQPAGTPDRQP